MGQTVLTDLKVETLEAKNIKNTGAAATAAPTASTPGSKGDLKCTDDAAYICLGGSGSSYVWKQITLAT